MCRRNRDKGKVMTGLLLALCLTVAACGGPDGMNASGDSGQTEENGSQREESEVQTSESGETSAEADSEGAGESVGDSTEGSVQEESEMPDAQELSLKDLCSDYFSLGVGINGSTLQNLTTYDEEYMALVKQHFNSVTMSNLMKSAYILQQKESQESADGMPALDFTCIDDTLQWCMDNGVKMRGHTLVWHTQAPGWFFREGYKDDGAYVDKETMLARMESYIRQLLEHVQENYPGVIYCWDVVNEAVDPDKGDKETDFSCRTELDGAENPWYVTIGPEYVEYAFTYARKYAEEDVKLFYNDFNTYQTAKRNYIYKLCKSLKEKGLIDGIGMQGYWGVDYPNITSITGTITYFATLGLEIQITELSVGVDEETEEQFEKQAKRYRDIFMNLQRLDTAGGGNANITNVTFFGLKDHYVEGDSTNARLFDRDNQPKPAFDEVAGTFWKYYQ